jgi:hypothetical protein
MNRRSLVLGAMIEAVIVLLAVFFEPTQTVRGTWRGEVFYAHHPTSFWRGIVVSSLRIDWANFANNITWRERVRWKLGWEERYTSLQLLADRRADPVLRELARDDDPRVAAFAEEALHGPRGDEESTYRIWIELLKKHNLR